MQKLYCYVDETGKEIGSQLFIISVVAICRDREKIIAACEGVEKSSGKGKFKWGKARHEFRMAYLRQVLFQPNFPGGLFYSVFPKTGRYDEATIAAIFKSIRALPHSKNAVGYVYVDALSKTKSKEYAVALRKSGLQIHHLRGVVKDESNVLVRLADAIAGFVGDALADRSPDITTIFEKAKREGALVEV